MGFFEHAGLFLAKRQGFRKIVLHIVSVFLNSIFLRSFFESLSLVAAFRLDRESGQSVSVQDYVDLSFKFGKLLNRIAPVQIKNEITELMRVVSENKPAFVLEIGTARGGTLFLLTRVSSPHAKIISIDLPQGDFGGIWYPDWKTTLYRSFALPKQKMFLIRGNSHSSQTVDAVKTILANHRIDFLFLDGDHTYEGVKLDFQNFFPLVRAGGIIAFHDIHSGPKEIVGGVDRYWKEIKDGYSHREIIESREQKGFGIGLLYK